MSREPGGRLQATVTPTAADSESEVRDINTCDFGKDSIPTGYARTAPVSEDPCPYCKPGSANNR